MWANIRRMMQRCSDEAELMNRGRRIKTTRLLGDGVVLSLACRHMDQAGLFCS